MALAHIVESQIPFYRPVSQRVYWESVRAAKLEQIGAVLYKAGVPEQYHESLKRLLRKRSLRDINTALLLYEGLGEDSRLDEKMRVELIPELIGLVGVHGASVFANEGYLDEIINNYLARQKIARPENITNDSQNGAPLRFRDQSVERIMSYRGEVGIVVYGTFVDRRYREYHTNRLNDRHLRISGKDKKERLQKPLKSEVQKVNDLLEAISSPNPDWTSAKELYQDIQQIRGKDIFSNRSLYTDLLAKVGIVIEQELPIMARLEIHQGLQIPVGYSIMPASGAVDTKPRRILASLQPSDDSMQIKKRNPSRASLLERAETELREDLEIALFFIPY